MSILALDLAGDCVEDVHQHAAHRDPVLEGLVILEPTKGLAAGLVDGTLRVHGGLTAHGCTVLPLGILRGRFAIQA
jgi:hypothetical protein